MSLHLAAGLQFVNEPEECVPILQPTHLQRLAAGVLFAF